MSTTVTYKGSTLTTVNNQTRTLKTAGKYMEGDVILTDDSTTKYTITITSSSNNSAARITYKNVNYYSQGTVIQFTPGDELSLYAGYGRVDGGTILINGETVAGNGQSPATYNYILPACNVEVTLYAGSYTAVELTTPTISIIANGNYDVINYARAIVSVPSEGAVINNQNKTVTPSESQQSITADSGYTGLGTVTVSAISSTYVGSGIARKSSTDLTVSGATVTAPAGYYSTAASKSVSSMTLPTSAASSATSGYTSKATIGRSTAAQYINIPPGYNSTGAYYVISAVANGSATAPASISGTAASVSTGNGTLTLTKTVSVTPSVTAGYVSSGTTGNSSVSLTASVTTKAAATITPGTSNQTIAADTYLTGAQTIAGDADLVGSNILSTANIFGVQGTVDFIDVYIRSTAPTSSIGNNGDIYIQE